MPCPGLDAAGLSTAAAAQAVAEGWEAWVAAAASTSEDDEA